MKLAISVFLAYNFKHSNQNDSLFSIISKTFQSMTERKQELDK